jgi:hypothetical protein
MYALQRKQNKKVIYKAGENICKHISDKGIIIKYQKYIRNSHNSVLNKTIKPIT